MDIDILIECESELVEAVDDGVVSYRDAGRLKVIDKLWAWVVANVEVMIEAIVRYLVEETDADILACHDISCQRYCVLYSVLAFIC